MKKITKMKFLVISLYIIFSLMFFMGNVYATGTITPGDFEPDSLTQSDVKPIINMINPVVGTIKTVGIVVAVIMIAVIGFKIMTGSIEEKAEYKKKLIPYIIGIVLVVAITQILGIIIELVAGIQ